MSRITILYCKNNFFTFLTEEDGKWVRNSNTDNIKSFGAYNCSCNKIWSSARSISNVKQYCQNCGLGCFPLFIWKNTLNKKRIINNGLGKCICENKKSKPFFPLTCCYIIFIFIIIIVILEYIITLKDSNLRY
jgi:hypothetical protein